MTTEQPAEEVTTESAPVESHAEEVVESAPTEQAEAKEESAPSESSKVQDRINKITRDKYEAIRRADELERRLSEIEATKQKVEVPPVPKLEDPDINYDEAKLDAKMVQRAEILAQKKAEDLYQQKVRAEAQAAQQRELAKVQASYDAKVAEVLKERPDFTDMVQPLTGLNPDLQNAILRDENGPRLALMLAENLDKADAINRLDAVSAGRELERLSAQLAKQPKPSTNAPPPPTTIEGTGALPDEMSRYKNLDGATFE